MNIILTTLGLFTLLFPFFFLATWQDIKDSKEEVTLTNLFARPAGLCIFYISFFYTVPYTLHAIWSQI